MSEQPFQDSEILWRHTQEGHGEVVVVKAPPSNVDGVMMFYRTRKCWVRTIPSMGDVAAILRELTEARQEREKLKAEIGMLAMGFKPVLTMKERVALIKQALDMIAAESPAQPQPADGGKEG